MNWSPKINRMLFSFCSFNKYIQVFVFWVLHSFAPGEITVFCVLPKLFLQKALPRQENDIKASMPPKKGGFTWTPKYCWIPARLGEERDGILWGREASTSFLAVPRMLRKGWAHRRLWRSPALGTAVGLSMAKPAEMWDDLREGVLCGLSGAKQWRIGA